MVLLSFYTTAEKLCVGDLVIIDPADGKLKKATRPPWDDESAFYLLSFERSGDIVRIPDRFELPEARPIAGAYSK